MTLIVVCFDVSDDKRLRKVAKALESVGQRVQRSVFECHLDAAQLLVLKAEIEALIDPTEDHVRYYPLCAKDVSNVNIEGVGEVSSDPDYHLF